MTLLEVQVELKAPKSQYNSYGKYKYRSTDDILSAVKPLLKKYGDNLELSDEPVLVGDWHYIKATATFKGKDGNTVVSTGYARESPNKKGMDDSQITGAASSYARKYALNGLFLIDDTKDADTNEYHQQSNRQPRKQRNASQTKNDQPSLLGDKARYEKLQKQLMAASNLTAKAVNDSLMQMAKIQKNDSVDAKYRKMIKAAEETLKEYQSGGNNND